MDSAAWTVDHLWMIFLGPLLVYLGARIVFIAYFHAKRDFIRRFLGYGTDQTKDRNGS